MFLPHRIPDTRLVKRTVVRKGDSHEASVAKHHGVPALAVIDADFEAMVAPHRRELLAYCYRMVGSFHDAEDLLQDTLVRARRTADRYDPQRASVRTWLYRIAERLPDRAGIDPPPPPAGGAQRPQRRPGRPPGARPRGLLA